MASSRALLIYYSIQLLLILAVNASDSDNLSCPPSSTFNNSNSSSYQIILSSLEPYRSYHSLHVKLRFNNACLSDYQQDDKNGPSWFKIEAIYLDTETPALGEFEIPINFGDASLKEKSTVVIFESNHPSVFDLQGKYRWTPNHDSLCEEENKRPVCFRATVRHYGSTTCEMTQLVCIPASNDTYYTTDCINKPVQQSTTSSSLIQPTSTIVQDSTELQLSSSIKPSITPTTGPSASLLKECMEQWPCTEAKLKDYCGSNGVTYRSRCHWRRGLCLAKLKKKDVPIKKGACPSTSTIVQSSTTSSLLATTSSLTTSTPTPTPEVVIETKCLKYRRIFPDWKPECMSNGNAKPVQCDRRYDGLWCWCSFSDASERSGTRKLISNCNDENEMDCLTFF